MGSAMDAPSRFYLFLHFLQTHLNEHVTLYSLNRHTRPHTLQSKPDTLTHTFSFPVWLCLVPAPTAPTPAPALLQAHRCPCFENNEKNLRPSLLLHLLSPNPSLPQISGFPPPALAWGRCHLCLLLYRRVSLFNLTVSVMWRSIQ